MLYGKHFYSDAPLEASPLSMVFPPVILLSEPLDAEITGAWQLQLFLPLFISPGTHSI